MKLVSAVITTHNRLPLLKRAVDSVRSQTYQRMELIVVDDASEDGTKEYCQSAADVRYIFIPKEESRGGNYARNLGIKAAEGEYVAFLDDDDAWMPEKIAKQVALIEEKDCELVYCGRRMEYVLEHGMKYRDILPSPYHHGDMRKKILLAICTITSAILCKKSALLDVELFDEKLGFWQEYELTIRLAQRKPFYYINEPLVLYRVDTHDKNRLTNKFYEWQGAVRYIHEKHKSLYDGLNSVETYMSRALVLLDGAYRMRASGISRKMLQYRLLGCIYSLPFRILRKLRGS